MIGTLEDQVIALAGLFQACGLVQQVARRGLVDEEPYRASIESLFSIDAESAEAAFGGRLRLAPGLHAVCRQLGPGRARQEMEVTRYAVGLLFLERKLSRDRDLMERLRDGIEAAQRQAERLGSPTHEDVIDRLAEVYRSTVSTLSPRILVNGESRLLGIEVNAARIRALLLAGVRAAVLWRQLGGRRWVLLLTRGRNVRCARALLAQA